MRYYDASSGRVRQFPNARLRFFFFGPFYLLWQRLWIDALIAGLAIWGLVRGAVLLVDSVTPFKARPSARGVIDAYIAFQNAAGRGVPADEAMRELVATMLPFYVSGFTLLLLMALLTYYLPVYLDWRMRKLGYVRLVDDVDDAGVVSLAD